LGFIDFERISTPQVGVPICIIYTTGFEMSRGYGKKPGSTIEGIKSTKRA
jgi:hypothetical protein